jgi:hypothetical protein
MQFVHGALLTGWIAPDTEVSANMQRGDSWVRDLKDILKGLDIPTGNNVLQQIRWLHVVLREEVVHVTLVAAGIVAVTVGTRIGRDTGPIGSHGTETDRTTGGMSGARRRRTR